MRVFMAEHGKAIEIGDVPEILRLAEEVRRAGEPRVLQRNGESLAVVVPLSKLAPVQFKKPTAGDLSAFRRAAGSWADIDTDELVDTIYRGREEGTRPASRP
jgi:hypothetical protein